MKIILSLMLSFGMVNVEAQLSYPITFTHDGKTVFGTFTTPDGAGRFPTIIINPGSGANDRDGTLLLAGGNVECLYPDLNGETLKPYKELAEALVDSGYAVLRYDKLEFTYPTTLGSITFHKLWLPVESAIDYVKTRADVDTNRLILIGHSEGSSLIPFIARERTDIKALISIAGARTPFDSILAYQLVEFERICDGDTVLAQSQANQILDYFSNVRLGNCNLLPPLFGVSACVWEDYFDATDPVSENYNLINLPTLFLGLGLDINVPPIELDRFENEVTVTDDFWSIPGLIHYMTPNDDPHVSQILSDTIIYWLRQQNLHTRIFDVNPLNSDLINISPNPFHNAVNLQLDETLENNVTISIIDFIGKSIMVFKPSPKFNGMEPIDLSLLPGGQYIMKIEGDKIHAAEIILKQ
jgi:dienelactone hydrolase